MTAPDREVIELIVPNSDAWLFGQLPTFWTWVAAPIVMATGLVIVWREHRLARRSTGGTAGALEAPSAIALPDSPR